MGQFQEKRRKVFFEYFSSTFLDFYNIKTFHKKGGEKQSVGVPSATWLGTSLVSSWKESPTRKAASQKETQIHYNFLNVWSQMEYITMKEGTNLGQIHRTHVFDRCAVAIFYNYRMILSPAFIQPWNYISTVCHNDVEFIESPAALENML